MMASQDAMVQLVDRPDGAGRSTATLLASLAARLGMLHSVSGAAAMGAFVAGLAALGRDAARAADGARLQEALTASRIGSNGELLWAGLHIRECLSSSPASPILDHLRNDLALLLSSDLEETLALMPIPCPPAGDTGGQDASPPSAVDCLLGLWALARIAQAAVEAVATVIAEPGTVRRTAEEVTPPSGSVLR